MSTWNDGYTTDVQYTSFFHSEIAPTHLEFAAISNAKRVPRMAGDFSYCELGCGQGVTLNVLAATNPEGQFWGFDFNPAQIVNARAIAEASKLTNVHLRDWSFAQAIEHADELPKFDIITLHGILSWVSDENRAEIVRFIDRTLKPGGVVYASYNTQPGWAQIAPFRHLARQHYLMHKTRSDLHVPKILEFMQQMNEIGALYLKANPAVMPRLEMLKKQPAAYFAHEFLNSNWRAFYVDEIAGELAEARLEYACSATLIENVDSASLPAGAAALVDQAFSGAPIQGQLGRDIASNKGFRRDIYVRGVNQLSAAEQRAAYAPFSFLLVTPRDQVKLTFAGPVGQATGNAETYDPILDILAQGPATLDQILSGLAQPDYLRVTQALTLLVHSRQVLPTLPGGDARPARALNAAILNAYQNNKMFGVLAAPAARTGIAVNGNEMILFAAYSAKRDKEISDVTSYAMEFLKASGRSVKKNNVILKDAADARAHLEEILTPLHATRRPIWKALGII